MFVSDFGMTQSKANQFYNITFFQTLKNILVQIIMNSVPVVICFLVPCRCDFKAVYYF